MGSTYAGEAVVVADEARYAVEVYLAGQRDRRMLDGDAVEGLGSWSGRITAGRVDEWHCAHARTCSLELPDGRSGVIIFDNYPRFTGSGDAPFEF